MTERLPDAIKVFLLETAELTGDTIVWCTAERREWLTGRYLDTTWNMEEVEAKKQEIVEKDLFKFMLTVPGLREGVIP